MFVVCCVLSNHITMPFISAILFSNTVVQSREITVYPAHPVPLALDYQEVLLQVPGGPRGLHQEFGGPAEPQLRGLGVQTYQGTATGKSQRTTKQLPPWDRTMRSHLPEKPNIFIWVIKIISNIIIQISEFTRGTCSPD